MHTGKCDRSSRGKQSRLSPQDNHYLYSYPLKQNLAKRTGPAVINCRVILRDFRFIWIADPSIGGDPQRTARFLI